MQLSPVRMYADKNATSRDVDVGIGTLLVRSMFLTLQGEGPFVGRLAYFVRLGGCNLGNKSAFCQGCDTDFRISESKAMLFEAICDAYWSSLSPFTLHQLRVESTLRDPMQKESLALPMLVITGGEPSLHKELPAFIRFFRMNALERMMGLSVEPAKEPGGADIDRLPTVQVESNGADLDLLADCQKRGAYIVLSPKASAKGHGEGHKPRIPNYNSKTYVIARSPLRVDPDVLCYKYVVSRDPMDGQYELPQWVADPERCPQALIYVSPATVYRRPYEGEVSSVWDADLVDQLATQQNYAHAAYYAQTYNLRLSLQTHTLVSIP